MSSAKPGKGIPPPSKIPASGHDSGTHSRSSSVSNLTSASDLQSESGDAPAEQLLPFKIDDRVYVNGSKPGLIKFLGKTDFAAGIWAGVLLDDPVGKNDGSVAGVKYFSCEALYGIFARPNKLTTSPGPVPEAAGAISRTSSPKGSTTGSVRCTTPSARLTSTPGSSRGSCSRLRIGERVTASSATGDKSGIVRFLGETDFAKGEWAGIELDEPVGKNDGSVAGKRYFSCEMKHGLFAPLHKVSRAGGSTTPKSPSIRGTSLKRSTSRDSISSSISNSSRTSKVKLGVRALTNSQPNSRTTGMGLMTTSRALEEALKEKEQHIEQLLKEQDLERNEVARVTAQCEEAQAKCISLQKLNQKFQVENKSLEEQLTVDRRKLEDAQFLLDEENIIKSDLEVQIQQQSQFLNRLQSFASLHNELNAVNIQEILEGKEHLSPALGLKTNDAQIETLKQKCASLENDVRKLSEEKVATFKDLDSLKSLLNETRVKNETFLANFNTSNKEKEDAIVSLKEMLNSQLKQISTITEENNVLKNNIQIQAVESKEKSDGLIKELEQKLKNVSEELTCKNNILEEFKDTVQEKDAQISTLNQNLNIQNEKSTELIKQIQNLQQDMETKNTELLNKSMSEEMFAQEVNKLKHEVSEINIKEDLISKLKRELQDLKELHKERDEKFLVLTSERDSLNDSLEQSNAENSKLSSELQSAKQEIEMLNKDSSDLLVNLQNDLSKWKEENAAIQSSFNQKLSLAKIENEKLTASLNEKVNDLEEKDHQIAEFHKELETKETSISNMLKEIEKAAKDVTLLSNEKSELLNETEKNALAAKEEFTLQLNAKELKIAEILADNEKLCRKISAKSKFLDEKCSILNSVQGTLLTSSAEISNLNSMLEKLRTDLATITESKERAENTLQNLLETAKKEHEAQIQEKEKKIGEMLLEKEKLSKTVKEKSQALDEKISALCSLQESMKTKNDETTDLQIQLESLKKELAASTSNKETAESTLHALLQTTREECDAKIQGKDKKITEVISENEKLTKTIKDKTAVLEEKTSELYSLNESLQIEKNQTTKLFFEIEHLKKEFEDLKYSKETADTTLHNKLQTTKEVYETKIMEKEKKMTEVLAEKEKLSQAVNEKNENLDKKMIEINSLNENLSSKTNEIYNLNCTIENMKTELLILTTSNESSEASLHNLLQTTKTEYEAKLQENEKIIEDFKLKVSENIKCLNEKENKLSENEAVISALEKRVAEKDSQFDELTKIVEVSQEHLNKMNEQNESNKELLHSKEKMMTDFTVEVENKITELKENFIRENASLKDKISKEETDSKEKGEIIKKLNEEAERNVKQLEELSRELNLARKTIQKMEENTGDVHKNFLERIRDLEVKCAKLIEEKTELEAQEHKVRDAKQDLEGVRDSLMQEKAKQEEAVKDRDTKLAQLQVEVNRMQENFNQHKKDLEHKLEVSQMEKEAALEIKKSMELQHSVTEDLQQSLLDSEEKNKTMESQLQKMTVLLSAKDEQLKSLSELEEADKEKTFKITSLTGDFQSLEELLEQKENILTQKESECMMLNKKLSSLTLKKESEECLQKKLSSLEEENKVLKDKNEKLEKNLVLKDLTGVEQNANEKDAGDIDSLQSQIDFLNSIIVDMKNKNEKLQQENEILKMGPADIDLNYNDVPKKLAPRLFCDICDMFDLHDTDECPKQESFIQDEETPHLVPQGSRKLKERPYCSICGVFGHWTENCDEQDTY